MLVRYRNSHYRLARRRQRIRVCVGLSGVITRQPRVHKQPIIAHSARIAHRLARHRHNALALFARAFGEQLLSPQAEPAQRRRSDDTQLIPPRRRQRPHSRAQLRPRIIPRSHIRAASPAHSAHAIQQRPHIYPRQRRRRQPKQRLHRISPANIRRIDERPPKPVSVSQRLQRRPRVAYSHEIPASLIHADRSLHQPPKMLVKHIRLYRAARLGRHHEQRLSAINIIRQRPHRRRNRRIQRPQSWVTLSPAKQPRQRLSPQTAPPHSQHNHVGIPLAANLIRKRPQISHPLPHIAMRSQPPQPIRYLSRIRLPNRMIPLPHPLCDIIPLQPRYGVIHLRLTPAQIRAHFPAAAPGEPRPLILYVGDKRVIRIRKRPHPVRQQPVRNLTHANPRRLQRLQRPRCVVQIPLYRIPRRIAMLQKRHQRNIRHRVHRIPPNQRIHIQHIAVIRILSACACPQRPLNPRPIALQRREPIACEFPPEIAVCHLSVGNRRLAHQPF